MLSGSDANFINMTTGANLKFYNLKNCLTNVTENFRNCSYENVFPIAFLLNQENRYYFLVLIIQNISPAEQNLLWQTVRQETFAGNQHSK